MLEFIIALLLSWGYNLDSKSNLSNLDPEIMKIIQSDENYDKLGGDKEFLLINNSDKETSGGYDNIVVTSDPNPEEAVKY